MTHTPSKITVFLMILLIGSISLSPTPISAQVRVSPTPVSADLPQIQTEAQQEIQQETVFSSPTPSITPTEDLTISLEAKPELGQAEVRGLPEPEAELLDPIETGVRYPVTGRYFRWLQFRYDDKSLTGYGWVFEDLVNITGSGLIPDVNPYATPTVTPMGGGLAETRAAVTLTPGAAETLDAQARVISAPGAVATQEAGEPEILPTFTQPAEGARGLPGAAQQTDTNAFEETLTRAASGQLPPIIPILILAGAGLLGLIISMWRR